MSAFPALVASPMCAIHFDLPSVETCGRCGRFCCEACLPDRTTCPACTELTLAALPPLAGVAWLGANALRMNAVANLISALVAGVRLSLGDFGSPETFDWAQGIAFLLGLAASLAGSVFATGVWFYRAVIHASARGARRELGSPFSACFSWWVPVLNFFRPFRLTRVLLRSAGLDPRPATLWQVTWAVGAVLGFAAYARQDPGGMALGLAADVVLVVSNLTGASIVSRVKWPAKG